MISEDVLANKTLSVYERIGKNVFYISMRAKRGGGNGLLNKIIENCEGFACQLRQYLKSPEAMTDLSWLSSYLDLLTVEMVENGIPENPFDKIIKVFITKLSLISLQYSIKLHVRQHL